LENETARPTTAATAMKVIQVNLSSAQPTPTWDQDEHETDESRDEMDLSEGPHLVDVRGWGFSERVSNTVGVNE
jgi:hypothetical protein